jgi:hypothetical protein
LTCWDCSRLCSALTSSIEFGNEVLTHALKADGSWGWVSGPKPGPTQRRSSTHRHLSPASMAGLIRGISNGTISLPTYNRLANVPFVIQRRVIWPEKAAGRCPGVFSKLSKLLNQEDALGAPCCLKHFRNYGGPIRVARCGFPWEKTTKRSVAELCHLISQKRGKSGDDERRGHPSSAVILCQPEEINHGEGYEMPHSWPGLRLRCAW